MHRSPARLAADPDDDGVGETPDVDEDKEDRVEAEPETVRLEDGRGEGRRKGGAVGACEREWVDEGETGYIRAVRALRQGQGRQRRQGSVPLTKPSVPPFRSLSE